MDRRKFLVATGLVGATGAVLAAPAIAQSRKEINMVTPWARDAPGTGQKAQDLAKRIEIASGGSLKVNYFAAGERVGAFDIFDEVVSGNSQAYQGPDYYWKGKHPAFSFFTSVPFGMIAPEMFAWLKYMGGMELYEELTDRYGLKPITAGANSVQMGGWFNKEINSPDDLKGLKIRYPGAAGDVMTKLGASAVALPGNQIYENLVSGAIDAAEFIGPYNDYFMKFYEAAKYYYYPGFHEPGAVSTMSFNKEFWDTLNEGEQALIEACCLQMCNEEYSEVLAKNGEYARKLVDEHGVVLKEFNEDVYAAFKDGTTQVFDEIRQHDDLSDRIVTHYLASMAELGAWGKLAEPAYIARRNEAMGI